MDVAGALLQLLTFHLYSATLVEGPNDAQLFISNDIEYLSEACTINNGLADCTVVAAVQGQTTSDTVQETASPFPIQVGAPVQPTAGNSPSAPASSPTSPTNPSRTSGNSTPTQTPGGSSPSTTPTPTNQPSDATALAASSFVSGVLAIVAAAYML